MCMKMYKCVRVCLCVCVIAAVSEYASVGCTPKSPVMARYSQHQSHRGPWPAANGCQWSQ